MERVDLMRRLGWFLLMLCAVLPGPGAAQSAPDDLQVALQTIDGKRVALIVGNSDYQNKTAWPLLPNATRDVAQITQVLRTSNFEIIEVPPNATRDQLTLAMRAFARAASTADIALFYYAGHGFEYKGTDYLVPTDAPGSTTPNALDLDFVPVDLVIKANAAKSLKIFVFDACRVRGPVIEDGTGQRGQSAADFFGVVNLPQSVVLYSTLPGNAAYDYYDVNGQQSEISPFAKAFSSQIAVAGRPLSQALLYTKALTQQLTQQRTPRQSPQETNDVAQLFYFVAPEPLIAAAPTAVTPSAVAAAIVTPPPAAIVTPPPAAIVTPPPAAIVAVPVRRALTRGGATAPDRPTGLVISDDDIRLKDGSFLVRRALDQAAPAQIAALAEQGDATAQLILGLMYELGIGVARDLPAAIVQLDRAANSGAAGQTALAQLLIQEPGTAPADRARGVALLKSASAAKFPKAMSFYAYLLNADTNGLVPHDPAKAQVLWRAAADAGQVYARFVLYGSAGYARTATALRKAVAGGNPDGNDYLCQLGQLYDKRADVVAACLSAADNGSARARAVLALAYAQGDGVAKSDRDARNWARLAYHEFDVISWPGMVAMLKPLAE